MGAIDVLKKWDFYKKIPEDLTVSTLPGVSLSIAGCFIMFLLFILEFNSYLTVDYKYDIVMDEGLDQTMRINFNITVPDLPCEFASVDVSDMTGTRKHNMTSNIFKIRLDQKGRSVGLAQENQIMPRFADDAEYGDLPESDAVVTILDEDTFVPFLKQHHYVAVDFYAPWCVWCQRMEPVWTRVAKTLPSLHYGQQLRVASVDCQAHPKLCMAQFIRAYPSIMFYKDGDLSPVEMYFGDRTVEAFVDKFKQLMAGEVDAAEVRKKELYEQDKKNAHEEGRAIARSAVGPEGCRLYGHLYVKRVPGNFHVHLANPAYSMDSSLVNASHTVNELWFGEPLVPGEMSKLPRKAQTQLYTHRLDNEDFTSFYKNHTYVHYIKVVTNSYVQNDGSEINVYKYTAHSNEYLETEDLPSIMFRYDLSPMSVRISEDTVPFYHFITSACAIIGGVFTVIGIVDQIIHQTARALNKKVLSIFQFHHSDTYGRVMQDTPPDVPSNNIWHVDYNATVAKDAAMGWQGMGFVLGFNGVMFLVALAIFQAGARSTRFSLFRFGSSSILSAKAQESAQFTLKNWIDLLWHTPIRDTDVELCLGPEGTFYLLYQQYTARFLGVLSVFAMLVLLPLYLMVGADAMQQVEAAVKGIADFTDGSRTAIAADFYAMERETTAATASNSNSDNNDDDKWWSFAHATIRVMPHESPYLWVPVVTCYLTTLVFLVYYRRLSALATIPAPDSRRAQKSRESVMLRSSSVMSNATSGAAAAEDGDKTTSTEEEATTPENVVSLDETKDLKAAENQPLLAQEKDVAALKEQETKRSKRTHLIGMQPSTLSNRSLFVNRGVPKTLREQRMLRLLNEVFPGYVEDVSVVFNLAEFHGLQARRRKEETELARMKILHERELMGEKPSWSLRLLPGGMTIPSLHMMLANLFCCFKWCSNPVSMEEQEEQLIRHIYKIREEEEVCLSRILHENQGAGRAFVIFKSARLRARFVRRVRNQSITSILARFPEHAQSRLVRYVRELGLTRWQLEAAPEPDDIDWQSVSFPFAKRTMVVLLVNVCILVVLLLFTSPIAVTSAITSSTTYSTNAAQSLSDFVAQLGNLLKRVSPRMAKLLANYIPTLILVMINAVLLNVLQIAGRIQPISTDSAKERLILRTASVYLIFNTIFVPSLAFMSIDAVILYLEDDGEVLGMLGTLFLRNSGIFYVDYVLQRCFLGTALVLLRTSEYVKFSWAKPRALTRREQVQAVEADQFYAGTQSAMQISTLTVVLMFSTVVPLILPLGTLYFAMQHGVDKYSLLNVRRRIKGHGSIARTATHATCVSLLLYQGAMSGFILERGTTTQSAAVLVLLMGTYIVVLWGYVCDKEQQHHMIARSGHNCLERSISSQAFSMTSKPTEYPLSMLSSRLQPLEVSSEKKQGELEEPLVGDQEARDESVPMLRPLETLDEDSALLIASSSSDLDLLAGLDADSSDLYREPALRKSMRMSFGPQDLRDYGTWRQV